MDRTWTLQTVKYSYDKLSRLLEARYAPGANAAAADADLLRRYLFTHDRAGNRLAQSVALNGGSPTVTSYTYNAANQLSSGGATFDNNGNMTSDGTNSYTWDRANRLVEWDNGVAADLTAYAYDGLGNRILQSVGTTSPTITKYLLDLQPGLAVVLAETTGANAIRNVHSLRGIHAHKDAGGAWEWMMQDGLGSVRGVVDNSVGVLESRNYDPYGTGFSATGSNQTAYSFTGEPMDDNGLLYLRARYMSPALGQFVSQDSLEIGNRYQYANGNPVNYVDHNGLQVQKLFDPEGGGGGSLGGNISSLNIPWEGPTLGGNISSLNIPWEGPTLYGSWNPAGTGATGIAPISELTWTQSTFGMFTDFQGLGFGWTPPQGDYVGQNALNTASFLNGAMCPNLSLANQQLVIESLQAQLQAEQQQAQQKKEDEEKQRHYHIALGTNFDSTLLAFWGKLRAAYKSQNVEVEFAGTWSPALAPNLKWPDTFFAVLNNPKTELIHFNLELLVPRYAPTYSDYISQYSNGGLYLPPDSRPSYHVTAWELSQIRRNSNVCWGKTVFYKNGTVDLTPSADAKVEICSSTGIPMLPSGT